MCGRASEAIDGERDKSDTMLPVGDDLALVGWLADYAS